MRKVGLSDCEAGMILGKAVYFKGSTILLEAGAELTLAYIKKLSKLGITEIYIEDSLSQGIVIRDVVNEETRLEAIESVKNIMDANSFNDMAYSAEIIKVVNKIIDEILSLDDIIVNLMDIKSYDSYTFSHSVNVCILSIITGIKLNLSNEQLQELGIGAILHDIGKVMIPSKILLKKTALSEDEYETIKKHSILGYNILSHIPFISEAAASVALNHHERCDGKGYPNGLEKDDINLYSRIVAIVDIYDALSSDRIYRKKISTDMALEYLTVIAAPTLDQKILSRFVEIIPRYPLGTGVVLNTGETAIVTKLNKRLPTKPIVRIVFDACGEKKFIYDEVNLAESTDYYIVSSAELHNSSYGNKQSDNVG